MPPKKPASVVKADVKKKDKILEDKTFGLKNKKGSKQQKFIAHVEKQVKGDHLKRIEDQKKTKQTAKDKQKQELDELNALFKPVLQQQKVAAGVDPKSVVCVFFKGGKCQKGFKCKFSHDLTLDRKTEKRNIYDDGSKEEGMDDWDEAKLEDVVNTKHGEANSSLPTTSIICKFFLDAVEGSKYGWFWSCPNGPSCHYRHALPAGFVLKKDKVKESKEDQISIEELVERERASLGASVTRVTLETFLKWKERKKKEKIAKSKKETDKKKQEFKAGKSVGISGRLMFEFNPDLVQEIDNDDDDGGEVASYAREDQEEDVDIREINVDAFVPQENIIEPPGSGQIKENGDANIQDERTKLNQAAAAIPSNDTDTNKTTSIENAGEMIVDNVPIDENLFDADDMDLDEDLDSLDIDD